MDILNKLVQAYNTAGINDKNVAGNRTNQFLSERVDSVAKELDDLEIQAEIFKRDNHLNDVTSQAGQYLNLAMNFDNDVVQETGKLQLLHAFEESVRSLNDYSSTIPATDATAGELAALITKYNSAVLDYQDQLKISTAKDPFVGRQKSQLRDLRVGILTTIQSAEKEQRTRIDQLTARRGTFEGLLASMPAKEREFLN
jgi:uncharacterized protein involved in exopolysaccharide biosynthesis